MDTLEENIKGLREFIKDEDVYQFYKRVIEEYSDEHARKALKNAREKMEFEYGDYEETPDFGYILSEDNLPKH